jgi:hypothetical protein
MLDGGLDPLDVGHFVVAQMLRGAFYIFTHADFRAAIAQRQAELLSAVPLSAPLTLPG